ncbi:hypothetical protein JXB27_03395 [Candidatus Woesearchaeota archaeon]|nr:hypothetical protein [Candidatus Woesearchaeota archaeon]
MKKKENKTLDWIISLSPSIVVGAGAASDCLFGTNFMKYMNETSWSLYTISQGVGLSMSPLGEKFKGAINKSMMYGINHRYEPLFQKSSKKPL